MFIPLCNFTHYSLQLGFSKPKELVKKCVKNNYPACGIADYKTIGGAVAFFKECKSKGIKPIIGCSFNGFSIFARNEDGWKDLISIISNLSKDEEIVLDAPLDKFELDVLKRFCKKGNLIYLGCTEYAYLVPEHLRFFKGEEIKDYYYVDKSDYDVHRISLCSNLKLTLPEIPAAIKSGKNKQLASYVKFFTRNDFNIPDASEATESKTIEQIVALCDDYNILKSPVLPEFPTPNGETEEEYLKHLCRIGWKELIQD
jgi:DNA polymerase III alpha subunit